MSKHKFLILLLICLSLLVFSACNRGSSSLPSEMPDVGIPLDEINTRLSLSIPEGIGNSYKNGDALNIMVKVISNDQVSFDIDYGARIFTYEGNEWKELNNSANYTNPTKILLSPAGNDPFKQGLAGLAPSIDNLKKEIPIRIILVGKIYKDGKETEHKTGAYIDVVLKP